MRHFSFYHRETGIVHAQRFASDAHPGRLPASLAANTPADHVAIEGVLDHLSQRVDVATGDVVEYQPPAPSPDHVWDAATRRWRLSEPAAARAEGRRVARAQIHALEQGQGRALREAALGVPGARDRLREIDERIDALRTSLRTSAGDTPPG